MNISLTFFAIVKYSSGMKRLFILPLFLLPVLFLLTSCADLFQAKIPMGPGSNGSLSDIFVINDKRPLLGMTAMIVGSASNIVLNYILLFECNMGIGGSALATILAHLIGFVMLLSHFVGIHLI